MCAPQYVIPCAALVKTVT